MTPLHAALDAADARDYGHCRELLAELSDEQVQAARVTYLAAAAQCDVVRYREPPAPSGVDGYKVGGATGLVRIGEREFEAYKAPRYWVLTDCGRAAVQP